MTTELKPGDWVIATVEVTDNGAVLTIDKKYLVGKVDPTDDYYPIAVIDDDADLMWLRESDFKVAPKPEPVPFDFLAESERTASGQFHGHLVALSEIEEAFKRFIAAANDLDRIKKLLFYGEDPAKGRIAKIGVGKSPYIDAIFPENRNGYAATDAMPGYTESAEHILHGVMGMATEAGELVEALQATIFEGKSLDLVNLSEEIGDSQWYEAMLCRVMGKTFDDIQRTTIEKLRARFPDKFTTEAANNRDLTTERAVLEGGPIKIHPNIQKAADEYGQMTPAERQASWEQAVAEDEAAAKAMLEGGQ